jgi:hypothetical protein
VEAEQVVLQRHRSKIQELDLVAHRNGRARIIELLPRKPRLLDERVERNAGLRGACVGEPAHRAVRARQPFGAGNRRTRFASHSILSGQPGAGRYGQFFGR